MSVEQRDTGRWQGDARLGLLLLLTFLWLWLCVDPSRTYHGAGLTAMPAFSPDSLYLQAHLAFMGGPLRYASAWLGQLFVWPAVGAAILTLLAAAAAVSVDRMASAIAGRRLSGYRYGPVLLFALLDGHYIHLLDWQLGWVVALLAADLCVRWPETRPAVRLPVLLGVLTLLYGLLGGPSLVALPIIALAETRRRELRWLPAVLVPWQALLPWLSTRCGFDQPVADAYLGFVAPIVANDQYGLARAASVGMVAFGVMLAGLAVDAAKSAAPRRSVPPALAWVGLAACCVLLVVAGQDRVEAVRLEISKHAARREWNALLATADRLAPADVTQFDGYAILLALAHTNRVGDSLYRYGLQPFSLLRPDDRSLGDTTAVLRMRSQSGPQLRALELELGFVNEAEHQLHESLETQGSYPSLLVPMARIQALNGRPGATRVFLRLAAAMPGDPAGARGLLREMRTDPLLTRDAVQIRLAHDRVTTDIYDTPQTTYRFEQAAREHPDNDLAQQYRMAWYVLTHQLDRLVAALPGLPRADGAALPRHYEEAVICYEAITGKRAEIGPWTIRGETRQRFEQFIRALGCDSDEAAKLLRVPAQPPEIAGRVWQGPWSDTAYYYRLFGTSGAVR